MTPYQEPFSLREQQFLQLTLIEESVMKKIPYQYFLFLIVFLFMCVLLLTKPFIGIADNGDFSRVIQPLGFASDTYPRFFYAVKDFYITTLDNSQNLPTVITNIIVPPVENEHDYTTTHSIFIKFAMVINTFTHWILGLDISSFDIRSLGIVYILIYSIGLTLFISKIHLSKPKLSIVTILLTLIMFCDIGYLVHFHSFFGEAAILVSLFLIAGLSVFLIHDDKERKIPLLLFFISCLLFIGAKVANAPVGILLALFSLSFLLIRKDKIIIIVGSVFILLFSILTFTKTPDWMKKMNNYNTVFYGVLKDSPSPEQDLIDMGIDMKYSSLKDSSPFSQIANYRGDEITKEVYEKASHADVLLFYLTHPERFIEKLILAAENSVPLKPSYLNNFEKDEHIDSLSFTNRFSLWESLRKQAVGHAFIIILGYSIIYFSCIAYSLASYVKCTNKEKKKLVRILANLLLLFTAAGQFIIPIVGNGEADIQKHMFLFNICFDLMLLIGVMWILDRLNFKKMGQIRWLYVVTIILLLSILTNIPFSPSKGDVGDVITFGEYEGKPLQWIVINRNKNGSLLWLNEPVSYQPFDVLDKKGINHWRTSELRKWLNTDFLRDFSEEELDKIQLTKLRNVISHGFVDEKVGGERPFYWTSIPSSVDQNYERAFFQYTSDKVFLLDAQQLKKFVFNQGLPISKKDQRTKKKVSYWLRTPYYSSTNMTRMVDNDGFVYHKYSSAEDIGVIPAIYIQSEDE